MPLVNVHMAAGRSAEEKKAMMEAITDAMVDTIGSPRESIRVWITEMVPNTDFMAGGELLADKQARLAAEAAAEAAPRERLDRTGARPMTDRALIGQAANTSGRRANPAGLRPGPRHRRHRHRHRRRVRDPADQHRPRHRRGPSDRRSQDRRHVEGGPGPARRRPARLRHLFVDMEFGDGVDSRSTLLQPRVEAEVALVLDLDLAEGEHPSPTSSARRRSRCRRSRSSTAASPTGTSASSTPSPTTPAAASTSSAGAPVPLDEVDLGRGDVDALNGEEVSTGNGAACLGDPLTPLRWLADTLRASWRPVARRPRRDVRGAGPDGAVRPGDRVTATISGLGTVTATFDAKEGLTEGHRRHRRLRATSAPT